MHIEEKFLIVFLIALIPAVYLIVSAIIKERKTSAYAKPPEELSGRNFVSITIGLALTFLITLSTFVFAVIELGNLIGILNLSLNLNIVEEFPILFVIASGMFTVINIVCFIKVLKHRKVQSKGKYLIVLYAAVLIALAFVIGCTYAVITEPLMFARILSSPSYDVSLVNIPFSIVSIILCVIMLFVSVNILGHKEIKTKNMQKWIIAIILIGILLCSTTFIWVAISLPTFYSSSLLLVIWLLWPGPIWLLASINLQKTFFRHSVNIANIEKKTDANGFTNI